MASGPEFSIPKTELGPDEFETYLAGTETRATITRNMEIAMGAEIIRERRGIFRFEDFTRRFTFDGSLKTKENPEHAGNYGRFFSVGNRFVKKGDDYILRGVNYLVSIDPTLEVRQKLEILWRDFDDALDALSLDGATISARHFIEQSATLDYMKNASITLFNALIQEEKVGRFRLDNDDYRDKRTKAIELAQNATQAYYAHLIGALDDYSPALSVVIENSDWFREVTDYVEDQYSEGVFSSRFFTRPEAGHPLVIAASAFSAVQTVEPRPDTIVGLPSGGTELAFAQQYAYKALRGKETAFVLIPLSLHSIKDAFDTDEFERGSFLEFLRSKREKLQGKNILIVEDNSSTGRTVQLLYDMLKELFGVSKINVSVAEADLIRTDINSEAAHRTHVASGLVYAHSVSVLPVSRTLQPKADLKEVAEKRRLVGEYRRRLETARNDAERIMYQAFVRMCEHPTQEVLDDLTDENAVLEFRHTFLSNFYATPIAYANKIYPSVEHAYHAQKFTHEILQNVTREHLDEINETLRVRGRSGNVGDVMTIFTDPTISSGNVKVISDTLRKRGYVRDGWDDDKMLLMAELLLRKFANEDLINRLLATKDKYLVEGNTWNDTLWGVCNGRGRNLLGMMLMEIRWLLRAQRSGT